MAHHGNAPDGPSRKALWWIVAIVVVIVLLAIWWMTGGWTTAGTPRNLDAADPFTAPAAPVEPAQ